MLGTVSSHSCSVALWLCPRLRWVLRTFSCVRLPATPWTVGPPISPVHGMLLARILEWAAMPSSKGIFPTQGSNPHLLHWQVVYRWRHLGK